jgi:hypothetical protein
VRILVLWSPCRGVTPGDDAAWARSHTERLSGGDGVAAMALHPVASAAMRHPQPHSWCLEVRLAQGRAPHEVIRLRPFADLLADLRLLGMQPSVLAIDGEL